MSTTLEYTGTLVQNLAYSCIEFSEWRTAGENLATFDRKRQESIGDWLNDGEAHFSEKAYDEALTLFRGYKRATLHNIASVAKAVPASLRNEALSWNHYVAVAPIPDDEAKKGWLERAAKEKLSVHALRKEINKSSKTETPNPAPSVQPDAAKLLTSDVWALLAQHATVRGITTLELAQQICTPAIADWLSANAAQFSETEEMAA